MVGFTGIGLIGYHLFGIPIGMTVVCLNIPMALISWKILGREFLEKKMPMQNYMLQYQSENQKVKKSPDPLIFF